MKRTAGFTLLEVLVALAVLAIAMSALIGATTQSVNTIGALRDQTFAGWVALNKINELLLGRANWPDEGSRKGEAEFANRAWRWETRFGKTDDPDMRRLEVMVWAGEGGPILGKLVAFKGRPPEKKPDQPGGRKAPQRKRPPPAPQGAATKP